MMAGLALCVSDLPEMSRLVNEFKTGKIITDMTPKAISDTINSFTPQEINEFKHNSIKAAKVLNWQNEGEKLISMINDCYKLQEKIAV